MKTIRAILCACLFSGTCLLSTALTVQAASKSSNAYQMALLQAKQEDPQAAMMRKNIEPAQATISEFEWILQSLQNRCLEPEPVITNIIVKTWSITRNKGANFSLLAVSRSLSQLAQNKNLFGPNKVRFQSIAEYWLAKYFLPALKNNSTP